ncbi:MAG: CO2 hydration protein [Cyanobacteria bacterium]|nr:CO2 hydration protein [Cyanobacteria bacterium CG_2015-16_32_12]NCO79406.1 CO2 hydration protein [Cyanobacteria bacterium CG_2015-22_32_23]NCQ03410.1 CO2 hydration protein [Cyanobacteria bacterium CG_2015-09_32_10]NCQ42341.1 CO2 hydration protein [Cyanobacteria bacterium CG_2015-04_32_10]NCS85726.1 CO2 hydration protein [Cyanobacteria bacterium CG_2015-02_32_10]
MVTTPIQPSKHPLAEYIYRLESGKSLLKNSPQNVMEVVGILKSYGIVLDAYSNNLNYIADHQFLNLFPFFKYFDGKFSWGKLFRHWWHDRINFEYAEYCMRAMLWHGGGKLDEYVDSAEFTKLMQDSIKAKTQGNLFISSLNKVFPDFLSEQVKMSVYTSALGQFWRVMSDMFISLSDRYDEGEINTIEDVVKHILDALVVDANKPITYNVDIKGKTYPLIPEKAGLTFLMDTAVPYVEAVFFRGNPFLGTVSFNAQANQISYDQSQFTYGALYADPLPVGSAGIPPTLLMQDMRHYLPKYLSEFYRNTTRGEDDLLVKICISFQKSMYCVTTAAIQGLAPHPLTTENITEKEANRKYLEGWMNRFTTSRILDVND